MVKYLVGQGASLTATTDGGRLARALVSVFAPTIVEYLKSVSVPVFLAAAKTGNLAEAKLFVKLGMSVETADAQGATVLHWAAYSGSLDVVQYLVEQGASLTAADEDGYMVLHWAAGRAGNVAVIEYLVAQGADVWTPTENGEIARDVALAVGNTAVAASLKSFETAEVFVSLAASGDLFRVGLAVENGININGQALVTVGGVGRVRTALHAAAAAGHLEVVKYLVGKGAAKESKDAAGATPLHAAVAAEHLAIVKYLVGQGAGVNAKDANNETPLYYAASYGNLGIVTNGASVL